MTSRCRVTQLNLRQATAGDRERLCRIQSEAMRPYVERIWGWDEDYQRQRFGRGYDPDTTQIVLSGGRQQDQSDGGAALTAP